MHQRFTLPDNNGANAPPAASRPGAPAVEPLLWDIGQVAAALGGISTKTVARLAADGTLPGGVRIGRRRLFSRAAIQRWIDQGCPRGKGRRLS